MKEEDLKGLENKLWEAADKMRGAVPVSSYKFIVLGLIFLKYISDSFEEKYQELVEEGYGLEEDRDSYMAENIFYVPAKARWEYLNAHSKDANIGQIIDEALEEIEKENPSLIISAHPFSTQMCGILKKKGKLKIPVSTILTDFKYHEQWLVKHEYLETYYTSN